MKENYISFFRTFDIDGSCEHGVFYQGKCDEDSEFLFAQPNSEADYYTTWSFILVCFAFLCTLISCVLRLVYKNKNNVQVNRALMYFFLPIAIVGAANSVGVFTVSQSLLGYNLRENIQVGADNKTPAISLSLFEDINKANTTIHLLPMLVSFIIVILLALTRTNQAASMKHKTFLIALVLQIMLLLVYLCVPYRDTLAQKNLYFESKLKMMYGQNTSWVIYFVGILVTLFALAGTSYVVA